MITTFLILALCNGALAMTLTKSRFFRAPRVWIAKRSDFWGELVQCPYCTAHWLAVAAVAVWQLRLTDCGFAPFDYAASILAMVGASSLVGGVVFRLFTPPSVSPADVQAALDRTLAGK